MLFIQYAFEKILIKRDYHEKILSAFHNTLRSISS